MWKDLPDEPGWYWLRFFEKKDGNIVVDHTVIQELDEKLVEYLRERGAYWSFKFQGPLSPLEDER